MTDVISELRSRYEKAASPLGNSPTLVGLGPTRGRKPNLQTGKTSLRRLVGHYRGALLRDAIDALRRPTGTSGASGMFFHLRQRGLLLGFSSRAGPSPCHDLREFPRHRRPTTSPAKLTML